MVFKVLCLMMWFCRKCWVIRDVEILEEIRHESFGMIYYSRSLLLSLSSSLSLSLSLALPFLRPKSYMTMILSSSVVQWGCSHSLHKWPMYWPVSGCSSHSATMTTRRTSVQWVGETETTTCTRLLKTRLPLISNLMLCIREARYCHGYNLVMTIFSFISCSSHWTFYLVSWLREVPTNFQ